MVKPELGIKGLRLENGRYFVVRREGKRIARHALTRESEGDEALVEAIKQIPGLQGAPVYVAQLLHLFIRDGLPELVKDGLLAQVTADEYQRIFEADEIGMIALFGKKKIADMGSDDIAVHLEEGRKAGRATMANRERSAFSRAFEWGRRQKGWGIKINPCRGVTRNKERPSKAYVETESLVETHGRANRALQLLLNGGYLSGIRFTDLALLERSMLIRLPVDGKVKDFIRWNESKTEKSNLMEVGPLLMEVFKQAIAHGDAIATKITKRLPVPRPLPTRVFVNQHGRPWTQAALSSSMRYAGASFAFRQLRAKAQTDAQNQNVLGHSGQMREVYTRLRKLKSVA